jgi:integrase
MTAAPPIAENTKKKGYNNGLKRIGRFWHYRFRADGQLLRGSTGCSNLSDAQKWLAHYRVKVTFEGIGIREMPTLRQLLDEWALTATATNQPSQIASMKSAMQRHCAHLLPLPIDQLTTDRVQATLQLYLATQGQGPGRQGHSKGGANALRLRLNTLMGYAIRCRYLLRKPYEVKKLKTQQKPRPVVRAAKAKDFLETLDRVGRSRDRKLAICLMFGLGVRESEALGMRWEFIDLERGSLCVGRLQEGVFITKGGEARNLNIPGWLLERLQLRWREQNEPKEGLVLPGPVKERTKVREPHSPGYTAPLVRRVGIAIGLPGLTPHRMRASFVTALVLEAKVSLPQAQRMVGHKHIATTMRYIEGMEDHKEAMVDLERLQNLGETQNGNGS